VSRLLGKQSAHHLYVGQDSVASSKGESGLILTGKTVARLRGRL